ncbi:MAG TPA: FGGY-family carbohydrate kinase, partial [Roseiflexaceae bacterium]|nr:FGGY-family carbohydrate kinase [Roseiflexaceae bacterium]
DGHDYTWEEILALAEQQPAFSSLIDPDSAEFLAPGNMPAAMRAFCARTGQPQPESVGAVARCCLESLALKYRYVLEGLEGLIGRRIDVIRIVGGGSLNRVLNQFTADACGRPVVAGPVDGTRQYHRASHCRRHDRYTGCRSPDHRRFGYHRRIHPA